MWKIEGSRTPAGSFNLPWLLRGQERRWERREASHWAAKSRREWLAHLGESGRETSRVQISRACLMSTSRWGPHTLAKVELRRVLLHNWNTASSVRPEGEGM